MRAIAWQLLTTLSLLSCATSDASNSEPSAVEERAKLQNHEKHRGVSWEAKGGITEAALAPLESIHANWIVQTPFGWQETHDSPTVELALEGVLWGELDVGLEKTARWARELGIKTLLKPHIWLTRGQGKWRSDIAMSSEEDWQAWFESYRAFILHYARLAERTGMEGLVVGTELHQTVRTKPEEWRRVIREVREVYSGPLTYAANWYQEYQDVRFWNALDSVGIQAYFPLTTDDSKTSLEELKAGWAAHKVAIAEVQQRTAKPILFTEIGYKSTPGAAREPWRWLTRYERRTAPVDFGIQERAYVAFFETFWHEPWFAGAYFWKWSPPLDPNDKRFVLVPTEGPVGNPDFSPQGKPAQAVLEEWYGK